MKTRRAASTRSPRRQQPMRAALALVLALLAGCGGGYDAPPPPACDTLSIQTGLRNYFFDWYLWYALSPSPPPGSLPTVDEYFDALLYTGTDPAFPADRWSFHQSTQSFLRFYGAAQVLGYGLAVADLEVTDPTPQPTAPLWVRQVEPLSPAGAAGVVRGDRVVSVNGRPAADLIAAKDFSVFNPAAAGDTIRVELDGAGGQRTVDIVAGVFRLTPLPSPAVVASPLGRKAGYLVVNQMLEQVVNPLDSAFASFASQGVSELVIDLRYNGGGLVSIGRLLASYVNPARTAGQLYASLRFSDKRSGENMAFGFVSPGHALALTRVYVLQGPRTCSAAEQVINALTPFVDVVQVGHTSCGKPLGHLPVEDGCGRTYSIVNFESVNARGEGRYFDGLPPQCVVAEDFSKALGAGDEPLLATALDHADGIACPQPAFARQPPLAARLRQSLRGQGQPPAMIPR